MKTIRNEPGASTPGTSASDEHKAAGGINTAARSIGRAAFGGVDALKRFTRSTFGSSTHATEPGTAEGPRAESVGQSGKGSRRDRTRGLSVSSKLTTILLLTSLLGLGIATLISRHVGESALSDRVFDQLTSLRSGKKQQIEWYFRNMTNSFSVMGEDVAIAAALTQFRGSFKDISNVELKPERLEKLRNFYRRAFLPELDPVREPDPRVEKFLPEGTAARMLQSLYIAENPYAVGAKDRLTITDEATPYSLTHEMYHDWLRQFSMRNNFYDVFLIDGPTGNIVYSVFKEMDFATNLKSGPYAGSSLGRLYRRVSEERERGKIYIEDFDFYTPSYHEPGLFIGVPVYSGWKFQGVLAAQVSVKAVNDFMTNGQNWAAEGLGQSGEMILVGPDRMMRSISRFMTTDKEAYLKKLAELGVSKASITAMARHDTTIMLQPVESQPVTEALAGRSGTIVSEDYRGERSLASYAPLDLPGLRWVLVTKIDEKEALKDLARFQRIVLIAALLLTLAITLGAMWLSRYFLRPVNMLLEGIDTLRAGRPHTAVAYRANDEFGDLTMAFNDMATTLKERNDVIEKKTLAYEALLKRIFPDVVAERMRDGDALVVDSFSNVSVIYLTIVGFARQVDSLPAEEAVERLNDLVDRIDHAAEALGIEKIKTIGEHYLAACGLSVPRLDHARRAVKLMDEVTEIILQFNSEYDMQVSLRAGIASGQVRAGLVGSRRFVYDVWGVTVNIARRIVYEGRPGTIVVSPETYRLLGEPAGYRRLDDIKNYTLGKLSAYTRPIEGAPRSAGRSAGVEPASQTGEGDQHRQADLTAAAIENDATDTSNRSGDKTQKRPKSRTPGAAQASTTQSDPDQLDS